MSTTSITSANTAPALAREIGAYITNHCVPSARHFSQSYIPSVTDRIDSLAKIIWQQCKDFVAKEGNSFTATIGPHVLDSPAISILNTYMLKNYSISVSQSRHYIGKVVRDVPHPYGKIFNTSHIASYFLDCYWGADNSLVASKNNMPDLVDLLKERSAAQGEALFLNDQKQELQNRDTTFACVTSEDRLFYFDKKCAEKEAPKLFLTLSNGNNPFLTISTLAAEVVIKYCYRSKQAFNRLFPVKSPYQIEIFYQCFSFACKWDLEELAESLSLFIKSIDSSNYNFTARLLALTLNLKEQKLPFSMLCRILKQLEERPSIFQKKSMFLEMFDHLDIQGKLVWPSFNVLKEIMEKENYLRSLNDLVTAYQERLGNNKEQTKPPAKKQKVEVIE